MFRGLVWRLTRASSVLRSSEMFFSLASASGISITSASWFPSPSTNRALKDPVSVVVGADGSCCFWVRSRASLFCRFDGGGSTVAMVKDVIQLVVLVVVAGPRGWYLKFPAPTLFWHAQKSGPTRRRGEQILQLLPTGGADTPAKAPLLPSAYIQQQFFALAG